MTSRRILILGQSMLAFGRAWIIKSGRQMGRVRLPAVARVRGVSDGEVTYVVACASALTKYGAIRTARKCFFRAFIIAVVLRKWGVPAVLNVGLRNLGAGRKSSGHCWASEGGLPIAEDRDPRSDYPIRLGVDVRGVLYWVA